MTPDHPRSPRPSLTSAPSTWTTSPPSPLPALDEVIQRVLPDRPVQTVSLGAAFASSI